MGLPAELVPLSWLLGLWEGDGVVDYQVADRRVLHSFHQEVSFTHDGGRYLVYRAHAGIDREPVDAIHTDEQAATFPFAESGFWSLARPFDRRDHGPAMLPGDGGQRPYDTAEAVEALRLPAGGFPIAASIVHSDGIAERYTGTISGPRIDLDTEGVLRGADAADYGAASRMYGLVDGHLLWAWDIAALGQDLRTHASARLARVDAAPPSGSGGSGA